ncbi:hypothetical protein [Cupriavidus sp. YAF13]|uniref:hypothetical protein n=1 Tax=Cupriavidus sp. YAF13 TaxID=3233075 RepID=UPI003F9111A0
MQKQIKPAMAAMAVTTFMLAACGGGSDGSSGTKTNEAPAVTDSAATPVPVSAAPLDAACLAAPAAGQKLTATLNFGPVSEVATFDATAIGTTVFDGGSYDTLEVKLVNGLFNGHGTNARLYIDPASAIFPIGVTDYGDLDQGAYNKYTKYRRFTFKDNVSGQTGTPNLVGMKPNETRSFTMSEANAGDLATKPQPALKPIGRIVNVAVQYIGREDVTAKGLTYKGACKLALHYDRKYPGSLFPLPVLEGTAWLAPGAGIVKLSGAPLVGVATVTAETTGIVAAN